ncbi:large ribosomal subunit protein P1-like [Nicotiana tabacum]|uniref:60S acidic ribosomal protein P1-like n=1 Tax=Nicotiana tabacum TaxID=4097 RepID=A0A1S4B492_TOBAC|nr:PREDICTED: 60S acidic ribosomal protein P1-like [Nicotiana tabacum]
MSSTGELACTYACLILHDDGIPINAEKICTLIKAANLKVESYWPSLFAKLCQKMNVDELVMNVGVGGTAASTAAVAAAPTPTTGHDAVAAPSASDKKKEEVKEESDDELMFSLFD